MLWICPVVLLHSPCYPVFPVFLVHGHQGKRTLVAMDTFCGCYGYILWFFSILLVILFFPFSLCMAIKVRGDWLPWIHSVVAMDTFCVCYEYVLWLLWIHSVVLLNSPCCPVFPVFPLHGHQGKRTFVARDTLWLLWIHSVVAIYTFCCSIISFLWFSLCMAIKDIGYHGHILWLLGKMFCLCNLP